MSSNSTNLASLARFQQKQLQEKEQKLLQLYDQQQQRAHQVAQRGSAGSGNLATRRDQSNLNGGQSNRTRQTFADGRRGAAAVKGIDKSYPLEPIPPAGSDQKISLQSLDSHGRSIHIKAGRTLAPADSRDQQQLQPRCNGHQRYEINIDDVIDDDAMERNRMVARHCSDYRSSNSSSNVKSSERYSAEKVLHDVSNERRDELKLKPRRQTVQRGKSNAIESRQTTERSSRNGSLVRGQTNGESSRRNEQHQHQPRFMSTTTSSSLKVNKLQRNHCGDRGLENRKRANSASESQGRVKAQQTKTTKTSAKKPGNRVKAIVLEIEKTASDLLFGRRSSSLDKKSRLRADNNNRARSVSLADLGPNESSSSRRASFERTREHFEQLSRQRSRSRSASTPRSRSCGASDSRGEKHHRRCDCCANKAENEEDQQGFRRSTSSFRLKRNEKRALSEPASPKTQRSERFVKAKTTTTHVPIKTTRPLSAPPSPSRTRKLMNNNNDYLAKKSRSLRSQVARLQCVFWATRNRDNVKNNNDNNDDDDDGGSGGSKNNIRKSKKFFCSVKGLQPRRSNGTRNSNSVEHQQQTSLKKSFSLYSPLRNAAIAAAAANDCNGSDDRKEQQQHSPPASRNSSSLKFLNKIVVEPTQSTTTTTNVYANENRPTPAPRRSSLAGTTYESVTLDEKPIAPQYSPPQSNRSNQNSSGPQRTAATATKLNSPNAASPPPGLGESLATCKTCKRRFNTERIALHEKICTKTAQKKRKQFDATTQRVKGTELESYAPKPLNNKKQSKNSKSETKATTQRQQQQTTTSTPAAPTKSNWRRKHEDFINAIRAAKQMQTHLDAGGKLSDLPPPPASDTSDYVKCPHCSRKFSPGAAERHIPKCENMLHNKPPRKTTNKRF